MKKISLLFLLLLGSCMVKAVDPTISVQGEAVVRVVPDRITIVIGAETIATTVEAAKKADNEKIAAVLKALKADGIPAKNLQTDCLSIDPQYSSNDQEISRYRVINHVAVTVEDPARVERIVADTIAAGANAIRNIEFSHSELRKYRDQARAMALIAAREKAEAMAAVLKQKIGRPVTVAEQFPYGGWNPGGRLSMVQNAVGNVNGSGGDGETLELGKIAVRAGVSVTFELKNESSL